MANNPFLNCSKYNRFCDKTKILEDNFINGKIHDQFLNS